MLATPVSLISQEAPGRGTLDPEYLLSLDSVLFPLPHSLRLELSVAGMAEVPPAKICAIGLDGVDMTEVFQARNLEMLVQSCSRP